MPSIASSGICAGAADDPVVMLANAQQQDPATLRPLVISKPDCSLDKCGKVPDHSGRPGLSYSEPYRNEMMFERNNLSCYADGPLTGIYAEIFETGDLIDPTFPCKLLWKKRS